ncbi:diacylglycerol kinase family protein [Microbacterium sp. BK668]|uniref:diacylglycerol/lipid kinase family protein n=1 Tax=Microbacterium sp. BK668 TaxID=2512118 RepID=UPI00105E3E05|nr:diacylglycerol kinase family protein [Microbacterium sp. BK668]TDN90628.1 diacylglycerol kinase family enzyme [Microbacterium sp. BK668]
MQTPGIPLEPRPTGAGVLIVRNLRSGRDVIRRDPADVITERLPDARVHELAEGELLKDAVARALAGDDPPSVLAVLGGDGSVSRMAHLARRHDLPLLVLPGGTFNHFARAVGIDDVGTAIDALVAGEGTTVTAAEVSAGDGEPVTVLNAISVGTYPQVIAEREDRMDDMGKWLGGVAATWRALHDAAPVVIGREGRHAKVWSVFISVGRNAPERVAMMQRQTIHDDLLDVRIHHARGSRLRAVASLAFGRKTTALLRAVRLMPPESDVERLVVPELDLSVRTSEGSASVYVHDGELEEETPQGYRLRCRIVPDAVRVYAPASAARAD